MNMRLSPTLSVVVPCYRSAPMLDELVDEILRYAASETIEIILVNDSSPDNTWAVIETLAAKHPCIRGFDMLSNVGQYRATLCGLLKSRGEVVVTMDDDLQHSPADIPSLVNHLLATPELDCVLAQFSLKRHGLVRGVGTAVMERLFCIFHGKPRGIQATSFRAMRRVLVDGIVEHRTATPVINAMLFQLTRRIGTVEVAHHERREGASGYNLLKLTSMLVDNVLSVSVLPLRCVSLFGAMSSFASFGLAGYYLWRYCSGMSQTPGFPTLVTLVIFFGGLTLISIGLVGEYLIRILREVQGCPRFPLRGVTDPNELVVPDNADATIDGD